MRTLRTAGLFLIMTLLCLTWMGCKAEEPTQWEPIRGSARVESSAFPSELPETTVSSGATDVRFTEEQRTEVVTDEQISCSSSDQVADLESGPEETENLAESLERSLPESVAEGIEESTAGEPQITFIANTNTKKFHNPDCSSVSDMKESNKLYFTGTREELIEQGYQPCKRCKP